MEHVPHAIHTPAPRAPVDEKISPKNSPRRDSTGDHSTSHHKDAAEHSHSREKKEIDNIENMYRTALDKDKTKGKTADPNERRKSKDEKDTPSYNSHHTDASTSRERRGTDDGFKYRAPDDASNNNRKVTPRHNH